MPTTPPHELPIRRVPSPSFEKLIVEADCFHLYEKKFPAVRPWLFFLSFCHRIHAHIPRHLWTEAFHTAVHIINRLPTVDSKTPYEVLYNYKPDYRHLHLFGCTAYVHLHPGTNFPRRQRQLNACSWVMMIIRRVFAVMTDNPKGWWFPETWHLTRIPFHASTCYVYDPRSDHRDDQANLEDFFLISPPIKKTVLTHTRDKSDDNDPQDSIDPNSVLNSIDAGPTSTANPAAKTSMQTTVKRTIQQPLKITYQRRKRPDSTVPTTAEALDPDRYSSSREPVWREVGRYGDRPAERGPYINSFVSVYQSETSDTKIWWLSSVYRTTPGIHD